jgi:UDPglucose--hexose-1-phosphate uridylyltransferase
MVDENKPHRRYNPLTGDWVLVSPQRTQRPWLGQEEKIPPANLLEYYPSCYLCPGNPRVGGGFNPKYTSTYVFDNDFPALLPLDSGYSASNGEFLEFGDSQASEAGSSEDESIKSLLVDEPEYGLCRVVCFSPQHDLSLPDLSNEQIEAVVRTWMDQTSDLAKYDSVRYVQIFENKGEMMGASNPHPHGQIWATSHIPNEPLKEGLSQLRYLTHKKACLLCDYLQIEKDTMNRIVTKNEYFTALVPFWAVWPFEMILIANRHIASLVDLNQAEIEGLAEILRRVTTRYDNLFNTHFPYSMGFHQAPVNNGEHPEWHMHAHYYPPLLRSATIRKFMVGFEMLASPQRDITPESAAEKLRSMSDTLYRQPSLSA